MILVLMAAHKNNNNNNEDRQAVLAQASKTREKGAAI